MAHTALGNNHDNLSSQSSLTLTTTAAVPVGDKIILGTGGWGGATVMTVTGGGLTWTRDLAANNSNDQIAIHSAPCPAGLASGTVLTVSYSVAIGGPFIAAASFANLQSVAPDKTSSATPATGTAWAAASMATTVTDTVVGLAWSDGPSTSSTPTSPWVEAWDATDTGSTEQITLVYQESVAAGSYVPAGTWAVSAAGQVVIGVAYKASAGGGATVVKQLSALGVG